MTVITRAASNRIEVLSDRSKTKIRDSCAAGGIHKDVWLDTCQYGGKIEFVKTAYTLKVTVNYVAGVEEVKALSDIR